MINLHTLHYQTGVFVALFLCLFTLTGLLLQHTNAFNLSARYAPAWLAAPIYGIKITAADHYRLGQRKLSSASGRLYLDGKHVPDVSLEGVLGAVLTNDGIWVASSEELILLSPQSQLMDRLTQAEGLPERISKLGKSQQGALIAATASGKHQVTAAMRFVPIATLDANIAWSTPEDASVVPTDLQQQVLRHANNHIITWERVITDLHSGQVFGTIGKAVANLISALILLVAATGIVMWFRYRDKAS